jgi:hypothetical protein
MLGAMRKVRGVDDMEGGSWWGGGKRQDDETAILGNPPALQSNRAQ